MLQDCTTRNYKLCSLVGSLISNKFRILLIKLSVCIVYRTMDTKISTSEPKIIVVDEIKKDDSPMDSEQKKPALHILSEAALKSLPCVTSAGQLKSARVLPLVYIQTKSQTLSTNSTGQNDINKSIIKSSNLIPVSVGSSKQTYTYVGIKSTTEGQQLVVPTNHLPLIPAPTNQKLLLTSMPVPKLTPRTSLTASTPSVNQPKISNLILPIKNNNQPQSIINFKITNGQIQSDSKGSITVLCDSKNNPETNDPEKDTPKEDLTEKSYELSIPEIDPPKLSPPAEKQPKFSYGLIKQDAPKDSTIDATNILVVKKETEIHRSLPSLLLKQEKIIHRKPLHEVSILKKCNLNSVDRKVEATKMVKPIEIPEPSGPKGENSVKPEMKKARRKSQYTYIRDFDEVAPDIIEENKDALKQYQSTEITMTKLDVNEDTTSTSPSNNTKKMNNNNDVVEIEVVKQENVPQLQTDNDHAIKSALKWQNGIGKLPGSNLRFLTNEFGIIEMLINDELTAKSIKKDEPIKKDEILCCKQCGCYGMPSEFICRNFCSQTCKINTMKLETKRACMAKRKQKKLEPPAPKQNNKIVIKTEPQSDDEDKIYPWQTGKKGGFSWSNYLSHLKAKAAPVKLFKEAFPFTKNGFRPGMKLEGVDPQHPSYFCVMSVAEVQGYRIRLHFDGYPENYDFWVNADSMDIFPVGWCEKFSHLLHPPPQYIQVKDFNWNTYLKISKATAAPRHLFANQLGSTICPNGFRVGMKLEAVDKKNANLVCVATVTDQMDNRFLVHFDSWDDIYDYWADPSSPYIHPVGWCDQFGHNLTPPNDYENPESFTWEKYLKETRALAAPVRAFKQRPSKGFKRDMKLECVDKRSPNLIRVATIEDVRDHQIKIRFDGWPVKYSFWIDDDSHDIHPAGWCQKTGHPLEAPLTPEDVYENNICPTVGCRGLGHMRGPKYLTHNTSKDCPYSDENLDRDMVLTDRLKFSNQEFVQQSIVPVQRVPKDKLKPVSRVGRPPKVRRISETKTSPHTQWPQEPQIQVDDSDDRKRKMPLTPQSRLKIADELNQRFKQLRTEEQKHVLPATAPSQKILDKHSTQLNRIMNAMNKSPVTWTVEEVSDFMRSLLFCRDTLKQFRAQKIDGEALLMLSQNDLVEILKFKFGPAIKLYNIITLLRKNLVQ